MRGRTPLNIDLEEQDMSVKSIILSGQETAVTGLAGTNAAIRNDGADTIYAAKKPGITPGADGVLSIPAGGSAVLLGITGNLYLSGTGYAMLITSDYRENPFKSSAQGGSGADETARAAINTHAGNAELHVTAAERSAWNAKADLSDIPDTSGFVRAENAKFLSVTPKNFKWVDQFIYARVVPGNENTELPGFAITNSIGEAITVYFDVYATASGAAAQIGYGSGSFPEMYVSGQGREYSSDFPVKVGEPMTVELTIPVGKKGYIIFFGDTGAANIVVHSVYTRQGYNIVLCASYAAESQNSDMLDGKHAGEFASAAEVAALRERVAALETTA